MKKVELMNDEFVDEEVVDYLKSVDGILDVESHVNEKIKGKPFTMLIHYDESKTGLKVIAAEYIIYMNYFLIKSFNKFLGKKLKEKVIVIKEACCPYCLSGYMEKLYFNDNISYVESLPDNDITYLDFKIKVGYYDLDIEKLEKELNKI